VGGSDRPDDTPQNIVNDNKWKAKLLDIMNNPLVNGIPWNKRLDDNCVLALDETPLPYLPKCKTMVPQTKFRRVSLASDKRSLSGTPVVSKSGKVVLFQVIFKGTTKRCVPNMALQQGNLYFDFAKAKCQTRRYVSCFFLKFDDFFLI
jgi:hypothetical protein